MWDRTGKGKGKGMFAAGGCLMRLFDEYSGGRKGEVGKCCAMLCLSLFPGLLVISFILPLSSPLVSRCCHVILCPLFQPSSTKHYLKIKSSTSSSRYLYIAECLELSVYVCATPSRASHIIIVWAGSVFDF